MGQITEIIIPQFYTDTVAHWTWAPYGDGYLSFHIRTIALPIIGGIIIVHIPGTGVVRLPIALIENL